MQFLKKTIRYQKPSDSFYIVFTGDWHIGHIGVEYEYLQRALKWIRENNAFWIGMGDWAQAVVPHPNEHRFDFGEMDKRFLTPEQQYRKVYELLEPIRKQGLMILTGNHDDLLRKRHYHNFVDALALQLHVPYMGIDGFLRLVFKRGRHRQRLDIYVHHGYGGGRSQTAGIKRCLEMAKIVEADVYAMGHFHQLDHKTTTWPLYYDNRGNLQERIRHFFVTGGFIRGYVPEGMTYIEYKMLTPTLLGSPVMKFYPENRKVEVMEI